ncbi:unnamed protein product [Thelazia callipaeda]|uniref:FrhB_FdhB_C domain-containing protein n=1 Tax=Thelazia callipaeda TaxID=103827 RepID=A0A0N5CR89_THECL|nr:unnamed protein product [Thelazia callipaeda]
MKEEMNLKVLLDGCPREMYDIATYLKSLEYLDEPNYEVLEVALTRIIMR